VAVTYQYVGALQIAMNDWLIRVICISAQNQGTLSLSRVSLTWRYRAVEVSATFGDIFSYFEHQGRPI